MRRKLTLFLVAFALLAAGATGMYLAVSIPNDIQAEALLRKARADLRKDRRDQARRSLEEIIRHYPRTDAAAAATTGLFAMVTADQKALQQSVASQLELIQKLADRQARRAATAAVPVPAEETATTPPAEPANVKTSRETATRARPAPAKKKRSYISIRRHRKR